MANKMKEAYLINGVRTPIGNFVGTLSNFRADDMSALTIRELIKRNPDIDPSKVDDVIIG